MRTNPQALYLKEALDTDRPPTEISKHTEHGYNPWSAPLAASIEPICIETDTAFHPLYPL